ncbi:hypothetical protein RRG08_050512 [Elysia crispata]|uniref:Uncharacterized protein n=1 Tax=Elysia crispata TaxID=231223 RepID=A0AAE0XSE0_9GAST|nr:hypothetical protein RRG08_050512 [Elysia crispata]
MTSWRCYAPLGLVLCLSALLIEHSSAQQCVELYEECTSRPCCQTLGSTICWRYQDGRGFCFAESTTTEASCQFAPCIGACNCCPSSPNCVPSPIPGATGNLCFP